LLAALSQSESLPRHLIYVGTTGIYGDCRGEWLDETRPPAPQTPRARRRLAAETRLREFGRRTGCRVSLLRAPGIYAAERLPRERLLAGTPTLRPEDDVYTNHIHADDLAAACIAALRRGRANRVYIVVDSGEMRLGEYFDAVAAALGLPLPPRLSRSELAAAVSPVQLSFMSESRRIRNRRLLQELKLRLRYPHVGDTLATLPPPSVY
jgi:nucleoside-diphosphate-sugar epimerase